MLSYWKIMLTALACCACTGLAVAAPVGNTFTYQGRLNHQGTPVAEPQDLEFRLYDAVSDGAEVGAANLVNNVTVNNGLFAVPLDFGAGAFGNQARYLEIKVKRAGSSAAFTTLTPRQPITAAPVALSVAAGGVDSTAIAPGAVISTAIANGTITRDKVSTDFTPILIAQSTSPRTISRYDGGLFHFDVTSKIAGFTWGFSNFTPEQSGHYMVSVSFSTPEIASSPTGSVGLVVNGMSRHQFGFFSGGNSLHSETWLQLNAGDSVGISVVPAGGYSVVEVVAGARVRVVRLD